jgi:hypothetical protein
VKLEAEFRALYPRLISFAGEAQAMQWLAGYNDAFSRQDWERFENLRAFPLYLRNQQRTGRIDKVWLVELALWEWTEFLALYSPVDETTDLKSLSAHEVMLNPSVQILRMEHDFIKWDFKTEPVAEKTMAFLFRTRDANGFGINRVAGDWSAAAIVDVLLEEARILESDLINELEAHQGSGHREAWLEKIDELTRSGLLLRG